ncbi:exosome complex exonuclease Rrp40 [Penicillium alfredii]|uniref:Exosome complex exonuclease Rrp40 n=1 Tax=Penicillium alfredii TaxID=1506179 RepID=A0A9W9F8W6_9EURO|nr:exosome complex exonuclease Rrp40 [Penicillium alfredii]KAJ5095629.1 exosome complex exonuclease Rrp40 [Penicillium alfredii]
MATPLILLPGDEVPEGQLPATSSNPLKLGPGLRLLSQSSSTPASNHVLTATQAGLLATDAKRNTVSLMPSANRRYIPTNNDLIIAQIHHSSADYFHCVVTPHTAQALLGQLSFEGATKKTRPMLKQGELVYARVLSVGVGAGAEVELTCVNPATGKAEPGGLGPLVGGMVYDVSTGMAARLIRASSSSAEENDAVEGLVVLAELGKKLESIGGFEIAVGRNGKVWLDCSNAGDSAVKATVAIGRCLQGTDERNLNTTDQRKLVSKVLREMNLGLFCRTVHIDANNFVAWLFILTLVPAVPMGQNSSQPTGLDDMSDDMLPEIPYHQPAKDGKKKKSRSSKPKAVASATDAGNGEATPSQHVDLPSSGKRKRPSEPEHKKKRKKHQASENHVEEDAGPINVKGSLQISKNEVTEVSPNGWEQPAASQPKETSSEKPSKSPTEVDEKAVPTTPPASQPVDAGPTPDSQPKGAPARGGKEKKIRGSRPGGKNNLKVGFFVPEEVAKLEDFKLRFCTVNKVPGAIFDEMVQHSERANVGEFPGPADVITKTEFWNRIYAILPDRDRRSVYRFMRRHFQESGQKPHEWTEEQDKELIALFEKHGPKWALVAKMIGRSDDDVTQRWKNRLEHRDTMRRGAWSEAELRELLEFMQATWVSHSTLNIPDAGKDLYAMDEKLIPWGAASTAMNHVRSRQQCADKWRKIRRNVMKDRASGNPDAVFDPAAAAKKNARWNVRYASNGKSNEFVEDDDSDDSDEGGSNIPVTPPSAPRHGPVAEQQSMTHSPAEGENDPEEEPSPVSQNGVAQDHESDDAAESESEVAEPTAAGESPTSFPAPSTPQATSDVVTPRSEKRKKDEERTSPVENEKTKTATKSKKRKHSETEPEVEPDDPSSLARKQKREKKRKKKEAKQRARAEAEQRENEGQAQDTPEMKTKKSKEKCKSTQESQITQEASDNDLASVAVETEIPRKDKKERKKQKKKDKENKRRKSEQAEPEAAQSPKKKKRKSKKAARQSTGDV